MRLLLLDIGAYTWDDIKCTLRKNNVTFKELHYCFDDKNTDDFFTEYFEQILQAEHFDAVFTVNYFPLVAISCHKFHIKYLSWSYDNPLNVERIEDTLFFETNYVFLFDRIQTENYQKQGFQTVFHLPLAVNPSRLSSIQLSSAETEYYGSDISFVGSLYKTLFAELVNLLPDYDRGFLKAAADTQLCVYGGYFLDTLLTEDILNRINSQFAAHTQKLNPASPDILQLSKKQLEYTVAAYTTRLERMMILGLLSKHYQLKLYSRENSQFLPYAQYMGTASYLRQMPKIFASSRLNLNITLKISQSGIPLRALDIMGCGGTLFSNYQHELNEWFVPDLDFIMYQSIEDTYDKAAFYLSHENIQQKIALNGKQKVFNNFSYDIQLKKLFQASGF